MGQLCRVTDPRGATTGFTYPPVFLGPARVATVTDRRGSVTTVFYSGPPAADFVAVDQAGRRQLFLGIDSAGRVADRYEGTTANVWLHHDTFTWDRVGIATTCRQPDGFVDNNLCRVVSESFVAAFSPNADTRFNLQQRRPSAGPAHRQRRGRCRL